MDSQRRTAPPTLDRAADDPIRGHTVRWTFADGPNAGKSYEHRFAEDGTVEWRSLDAGSTGASDGSPDPERPYAGAARVSDDVYAVSYLAPSGFTLTVVLNFTDHRLTAFASNEKQWFEQHGTFEVVG